MTTKEDQQLEENEESTLDEKRESEESENLEDLFEDDEETDEESDADKVKRLEEKIARIEKGVQKLATDKGRESKAEPKKEAKETKSSLDEEIVEELLLTKHPEAEFILEDLRETAKSKGVSMLKLFRESKYFQGEAKALSDAKRSEEDSKDKISRPSNGQGQGGGKLPFEKVDLSNKEHVEYIKSNPKYREGYNAFLLRKK